MRRPPGRGVIEDIADIVPDGCCGSEGAANDIMSSRESSEESFPLAADASVSDSSGGVVLSISVPLSNGRSSAAE
jgi:hypothetical protein